MNTTNCLKSGLFRHLFLYIALFCQIISTENAHAEISQTHQSSYERVRPKLNQAPNRQDIQNFSAPRNTITSGGFRNPLVDAADTGNSEQVSDLLRSGYSANSMGLNDTTALMRASYRGYNQIVTILVNAGADIEAKDIYGNTPLKLAIANNNDVTADLLLKYGADPSSIGIEKYADVKNKVREIRELEEAQKKQPSPAGTVSPENMRKYEEIKSAGGMSTTKKWLIWGGVGAIGATAAVIALNEDNGNDSPPAAAPETYVPPPFTLPSGTPSSFETAEYNAQYGLSNISASTSYSRGQAGGNTLVAVVDSGVDLDHPDLAPNIFEGYDFIDNDNNASPEEQGIGRSHGTHVAGIIAATKNDVGMHGVAYQAHILPVRAGSSDGSLDEAALGSGINYAVNKGAKVINNSWGSSIPATISGITREDIEAVNPNLIPALSYAVNNKAIVVFATGNDFRTQPSLEAGLPLFFPEYKDLWLAVGAVTQSNTDPFFNNWCGIAANWCLVAPGVGIKSTVDQDDITDIGDDNYEEYDGTSMATPHVSGAIAVLLTEFPGLTPEQVIDLLLSTATDLGDPGVDNVFGHGLLNLSAATQPQGALSIPTGSTVGGGSSGLGTSSIRLGSAFGDALINSDLSVAALDSYQRAYLVYVSGMVKPYDSTGYVYNAFTNFGSEPFRDNMNITDKITASFSQTGEEKSEDNMKYGYEEQARLNRASFAMKTGSGEMKASYNVPADQALALTSTKTYNNNMKLGKNTLSNPYTNFSQNGETISFTGSSNDITISSGSFRGSDISGSYEVVGVVSEVTGRMYDDIMAGVQFGAMSEKGSLLGSSASGAFAVDEYTPTYFSSMSASSRITDRITAYSVYSVGMSYPDTVANSLVTDVSPVVSDSLSAGLIIDKFASKHGKLGFAVTQPLRVLSGKASMRLPQSRDAAGNLFMREAIASLTPEGREIDLEMSYMLGLGDETNLGTGVIYRMEPGHIKASDPDSTMLMKFQHRF